MINVVKDVIKSKTMMGFMVLILGISYVGACQTQNYQISTNNIIQENIY